MTERNWTEITNHNDGRLQLSAIIEATGEWRRSKGFETGWQNFAEKLMLVVTEITEASEAARTARACWRSLGVVRGNSKIGYATQFGYAIENYAEEWIDVMVRIFDLIEACRLVMPDGSTFPPLTRPPFGADGATPIGEIFDLGFYQQQDRAIESLSRAMEVFRDVKIGTTPEHGAAPLVGQRDRIDSLSLFLFQAAAIAAEAIGRLGEEWPRLYAEKMVKNEGRPTKHGRER